MCQIKQPFTSLDNVENNFISLYGEITNAQKIRYE